MYAKSLQWQLIENKILENHSIKVTQDDVLAHTKVFNFSSDEAVRPARRR